MDQLSFVQFAKETLYRLGFPHSDKNKSRVAEKFWNHFHKSVRKNLPIDCEFIHFAEDLEAAAERWFHESKSSFELTAAILIGNEEALRGFMTRCAEGDFFTLCQNAYSAHLRIYKLDASRYPETHEFVMNFFDRQTRFNFYFWAVFAIRMWLKLIPELDPVEHLYGFFRNVYLSKSGNVTPVRPCVPISLVPETEPNLAVQPKQEILDEERVQEIGKRLRQILPEEKQPIAWMIICHLAQKVRCDIAPPKVLLLLGEPPDEWCRCVRDWRGKGISKTVRECLENFENPNGVPLYEFLGISNPDLHYLKQECVWKPLKDVSASRRLVGKECLR